MRWGYWLGSGLAGLVILLIVTVGAAWWALVAPLNGAAEPVGFTVDAGQHAAEITAALDQAGFVRSQLALRGYLRVTHQTLKAGRYTLSKSGSSIQNVGSILQGVVAERQVTIPEGLRLSEVAALLERQGIVPASDFIAAAHYRPSVVALPASYNLKADTFLEGFVFPDTYRFAADATATMVVKKMVQTFVERTAQLSLSYDQLILASIVEREAKFDDDRATIAGVYANRLAAHLPLQSNPTVEYARANANCGPQPVEQCTLTDWWPQPKPADFHDLDSPYNTYRVLALPPRPIANPGLKSLKAAVNPAKHDDKFFVTDTDGHAHFAKTFDEHTKNVQRYLK